MTRTALFTALLLLALSGCKKDEAPAAGGEGETAKAADAKEGADAPAAAQDNSAALKDPSKATLEAPATYTVKLETTKGDLLIDVTTAWAPKGAQRFYNLVKAGYYDDVAFFRAIQGFMAQVGLHGDPEINKIWREARIQDDPVKESNKRGYVTFATAGPNTRTTQFFLNFGDNVQLDGMGFAPFGKVQDESMKVLDAINTEYGEGAPRGRGPSQGRIHAEGNAYLKAEFPNLDSIKKATVVEEGK